MLVVCSPKKFRTILTGLTGDAGLSGSSRQVPEHVQRVAEQSIICQDDQSLDFLEKGSLTIIGFVPSVLLREPLYPCLLWLMKLFLKQSAFAG